MGHLLITDTDIWLVRVTPLLQFQNAPSRRQEFERQYFQQFREPLRVY